MNLLLSFATAADRLDPAIGGLLDHFRDEHVPVELSATLFAASALVLVALIVCGGIAIARVKRLRKIVHTAGTGAALAKNFARVDKALSASVIRHAWHDYRKCVKRSEGGILYLRRPDEFIGLQAIDHQSYPARFFAAAHGYFIGVGLVLTFVGLVAALKFAAAGVASPDIEVAKDALNALLAAAAFKFMTSIAGLGSSLILSIAARSMTYAVENQALGLAQDLEQAMEPVFSECLAYDQLAVTRAQLGQLERIETALSNVQASQSVAATGDVHGHDKLQEILAVFLTESRTTAQGEMKQIAGKLSDVGDAIGTMQHHIDRSGEAFADRLAMAAARLGDAATKLQDSLSHRADEAGARLAARIDALGDAFARGETMLAGAADRASATLLASVNELDASLRSQIGSMRDIVGSLDRTRETLDQSASVWTQCTTPVLTSVAASREITTELSQIARDITTAQHEMADMAKSVTQLSEQIGTVWENYRDRFEKVDDELQVVFERLQGGTRAFGEEIMGFVGKLDASLASGMQAFSLGTEELREVAQMFVISNAKAA